MATTPLSDLALPVLAAPMAGGPTTVDLVLAAARAGGLGFLAAGYQTAEQLSAEIAAVRVETDMFGVNLFTPPFIPVDPTAYRRYRDRLAPQAEQYAVELPVEPREDDDWWRDKVDVLLASPVPLVSFTFGIPDAAVVAALRPAGSTLAQTVTSTEEATRAADAGVDLLVVQSSAAGGHSGTLTPDRTPQVTDIADLVAQVTAGVRLPVLAAGGIGTADDVQRALDAGAVAVLVGTALLLAPESGTSAAHRAALRERSRDTVVTRSFTGRPARGLRNRFIDAYDAEAPLGYPALHHLTRPLRKASAAAGDPELVNLWAGTAYRSAAGRPAAEILTGLAARL